MSGASEQRLWHGAAPGRQVGDLLEPPADTGLRYTRRDDSIEQGQRDIAQRLDRVYVTTDRRSALAYAGDVDPRWRPLSVRPAGPCPGGRLLIDAHPDAITRADLDRAAGLERDSCTKTAQGLTRAPVLASPGPRDARLPGASGYASSKGCGDESI